MNLLFKILLLLISINSIKSDLDNSFCVCDQISDEPIQSRKISGRIYNGRNATKNELRYVGSIYTRIYVGEKISGNRSNPYGYSSVCTGFLINADHAITSGDCVSYLEEDPIVLKTSFFALGTYHYHSIRRARKDAAYVRQIKDVFINPNFNEKTLDNNIGVIKFKSPFVLGRTYNIQAACLADIKFTVFSDKLYTAGYGFINITRIEKPESAFHLYNTETARRLQVMSGLTTNKNCKNGKVCVLNADSGTCPQDGGSPLLYNYEGRAVVVGINDRIDKFLHDHKKISKDNDDYDKCKPNVQTEFTQIGLYKNWIEDNFGDKCVKPDLIENKKKLCECKPIDSKNYRDLYRGINGTKIKNKNDLTYVAHFVEISYKDNHKPPLHYGKLKIYRPFCSGSLINSRWILTAAHCIHDPKLHILIVESDKVNIFDERFQVGVSLHNLNEIYKNPAYMSTIKSVNSHPLYISTEAINDIGLVETDKEFSLGPDYNIWPPCLLNYKKHDFSGDVLIQAGFGQIELPSGYPIKKSFRGIKSRGLYDDFEVNAPSLDLRITKNYPLATCYEPDPRLICTVGKFQAPCHGDTGGPLIWRNKTMNKEYIVGVQGRPTSSRLNSTHLIDCITSEMRAEINVYEYIDWIRSFIGVNYCGLSNDN